MSHASAATCSLPCISFVRNRSPSRSLSTWFVSSDAGNTLFTANIDSRNSVHLNVRTLTGSMARALAASDRPSRDLTLWHQRCMHHHFAGLQRAICDKLVTGLVLDVHTAPDPICELCLAGKLHAAPFRTTGTITTGVLDLVHADLVEMPVRSLGGADYFVLFTDDASGFHSAYPLRRKSDTFKAFSDFKSWAENQTGRRIRQFQDDKGGEFVGKQWDALFASSGIQPRHSTRNRPAQNSVAERANHTLVEAIVAALTQSGLPKTFWAEAMTSFVHVWNRLPAQSTAMHAPNSHAIRVVVQAQTRCCAFALLGLSRIRPCPARRAQQARLPHDTLRLCGLSA